MKLKELLGLIDKNSLSTKVYSPCYVHHEDIEIRRIVSDSRNVQEGDMFACVRGENFDGHNFARSAVMCGAKALLCEKQLDLDVPQIICRDIRRNMGKIASLLYGNPTNKLIMVGLTGTNGKTTTTFMLKSILENSGIKTGLLGTVYYDDGEFVTEAEHTTPEGSDLQYWLSRMAANNCSVCIMEASSHAIEQGRIEGVLYDRIGFSNLTEDHLDYHKNMEQYFLAKKKLFDFYVKKDWEAAVNIDDRYGKRLIKEYGKHVFSFGTKEKDADFYAFIEEMSIDGMKIKITTKESNKNISLKLPILGEYNVHNALEALAIASTLNVALHTALDGLAKIEQIPGRIERYKLRNKGACVIDFAHSPDSLEKVLSTLRLVCRGELHIVFGAGGDRDREKRPVMGEIAAKLADKIIITSDNPRSEDPNCIISEIEKGVKKYSKNYVLSVDRKDAIESGLRGLSENDILLVAGRGPERYQIRNDGLVPLLDKDVLFNWCIKNSVEVYL